jgi:hypothetical protein
MTTVQIPAQWVSAGQGLPDVCVRHGLPATERRRIRLISRAPGWAIPLILFGAVIYLIVVMAMRKIVIAPAWPFCGQCQQDRARLQRIGLVLLGVGVLGLIGSIAALGPLHADIGGLGILLSIFLLLAVLVVLGQSSWVRATRAQVSGDGQWVQVNACEEFTHAALALQNSFGPPGYPVQAYGFEQPR